MQDEFPDVTLRRLGDAVVAEGRYTLFDSGRVVDQFQIRVQLPAEHPKGYPTLFEMGGRVPRITDRHVDEETGSCCVMAVDELLFKYPDGCSLLAFLKGPVGDFLISQSHYETHGQWPFGERDHGPAGRLQFYAEQVGSSDLRVGLRVAALVAASSAGGKVPCPCGSGRSLRKCHRDVLRHLRARIPRGVAREALRTLQELARGSAEARTPAKAHKARRRWWPTT